MASTTASSPSLPAGYSIHPGLPEVPKYRHLRSASGLSPVTAPQAAGAVSNSWYGCHIRFTPPEEAPPSHESTITAAPAIVGMGRIIGDGGWYFHIADMAVLPEHQRKGLGDAVFKELLAYINLHAPQDGSKPYITLFADPPGRPLYLKNEFLDGVEIGEVGMIYRADPTTEKAQRKRARLGLGGEAAK